MTDDALRIKGFLEAAEARSFDDVCASLEEINSTLKAMRINPYVHVTNKQPEIKLPDIHRKDTIIINFPMRMIFIAMAAPYVVFVGMFLVLKILPKIAIMFE